MFILATISFEQYKCEGGTGIGTPCRIVHSLSFFQGYWLLFRDRSLKVTGVIIMRWWPVAVRTEVKNMRESTVCRRDLPEKLAG